MATKLVLIREILILIADLHLNFDGIVTNITKKMCAYYF